MNERSRRYAAAGDALLRESGCTVRSWRTGNSGSAWTSDADWGIEVPEPRGPVSFGTFAHEVGHQLLHRGNGSTPRWLEEVEAWEYALAQFDRFELPGKERSRRDAAGALVYAGHKALRRCSPETAQRILDRYPAWVWAADTSRVIDPELTAAGLEEHAHGEPATA